MRWQAWLGGLVWLILGPAWAAEPLTLGVFAYRPKPIMATQYLPLVNYLNRTVPEARIEMRVLTQPEMEHALTAGELDLVFTNPSHFILLRHLQKLTGAMATLVALEKGLPVSQLGGVILTRQERKDIRALADLRGRRIAVPGRKFLGGYQTQAFELLQEGIDITQEVDLHEVGSHDEVIRAVLSGRADAGFVRTGIVEAMLREGTLPPGRIAIINRQSPTNFPFVVSTRLYPEWAFAALPHVDEHTVGKIASALLQLPPDDPAAVGAGIHGFVVPADYLNVENLARALRLPPYESAPEFTPRDIWDRYRAPLLVGAVASLFVLVLSLVLLAAYRRLHRVETARRHSDAALTALLDNTPDLMWLKDRHSRYLAVNKAFLRSVGKDDASEVIGHDDRALWPEALAARYQAEDTEVMTSGQRMLFEAEEIHQGMPTWMETYKTPILDAEGRILGTAGIARDISERRERERRRLAVEMAHREALVREVHHRIKNNLQSVAGLLRRELGKDTALNPRLETAISQVYSIARVHGLQSADASEALPLFETVNQIAQGVSQLTGRPIRIALTNPVRGPVFVTRDEAVPLALILNELLLNAVKHAPDPEVTPEVSSGELADGFEIVIANPVPESTRFDFATGSGIGTGLSLVRSLLPEQGAELHYSRNTQGWLCAHLHLNPPVIHIKD